MYAVIFIVLPVFIVPPLLRGNADRTLCVPLKTILIAHPRQSGPHSPPEIYLPAPGTCPTSLKCQTLHFGSLASM
ncbi:MAG: hypothetical protein ACHQQQ_13255 [Bacteroidota bacterium]